MKTLPLPKLFCLTMLIGAVEIAANAQTQLILNGGFESGSGSSVPYWNAGGGAALNGAAGSSAYAHSGSHYMILGGAINEVDYVYQTITVPSTATTATLSFWENITSAETTITTAYDTMTVTIRNTSGTILQTIVSFSNLNKDSALGIWHQWTADLSAYKGQTVEIYFASSNDSSLVTSFDIDDVSVVATVPGPPPSISSISPNPVNGTNGIQPFYINGANFSSGCNVTLRDLTAGQTFSNRTIYSFNGMQIELMPNFTTAMDNWSVEVINPDGQSSGQFDFSVVLPNLVPQNITLSTNSVIAGGTLTIDWTLANADAGNAPATVTGVRINQSTTSFSGTTLTNVPMSALSGYSSTVQSAQLKVPTTPGTYYVWIIADNVSTGGIPQSNYNDDEQHSAAFTVTSSESSPSVSSVSPNPVTGSNSKQPFTINGSGFISGAQVKLVWPAVGVAPTGSATLPSIFVSSSQLQVNATFGNDPATWTAQAINPDNGSSSPYSISLQAPVPVIQLLSPSSAAAGGTGFTLSVNGSTFNQSSVVYWNGVSLITTPVVDSGGLTTVLNAQVPASFITSAETAMVAVVNSAPGGGTSAGVSFTVGNSSPTTGEGVDYSDSPPNLNALKTAGYGFVIRYVGGSSSKDITASEVQNLRAVGLGIIIVFENTANQMQNGYSQGVSDANTAVAQAIAAGAPQNFFCYFACDFDAQPSDYTAINAYMDGVASVLGVSRVGFYGGYCPLKNVLDAGKASKGWQTKAWSDGNIDSRISLYQYLDSQTSAGGQYDVDEGFGNDLGQWVFTTGGGGISSPVISNPQRSGTSFILSVQTQTGTNYVGEYKISLSDATWTPFQTNSGTGSTVTFTDPNATGPCRLYRIRLQ